MWICASRRDSLCPLVNHQNRPATVSVSLLSNKLTWSRIVHSQGILELLRKLHTAWTTKFAHKNCITLPKDQLISHPVVSSVISRYFYIVIDIKCARGSLYFNKGPNESLNFIGRGVLCRISHAPSEFVARKECESKTVIKSGVIMFVDRVDGCCLCRRVANFYFPLRGCLTEVWNSV